MVEMEDIDLNDDDPLDKDKYLVIDIVRLQDGEAGLQRQKSHSCSDLENL